MYEAGDAYGSCGQNVLSPPHGQSNEALLLFYIQAQSAVCAKAGWAQKSKVQSEAGSSVLVSPEFPEP